MRRLLFSVSLSLALAASLAFGAPALALSPGSWNHVGTNGQTPAGPALNGHVYEMHATPSALYMGGDFTNAGGIAAADRIAKWNGTSWSALGTTPLGNGAVYAIATHDGKVYAGGNFVNAGGSAVADYLAEFDGTSWKPFCNASSTVPAFNGTSFQVFALQVIGSILWVGGTFNDANGNTAADYLVGCNLNTGAMILTVDDAIPGFTGGVYDLTATSDGTLYAGGVFSNLDGVGADRAAYYSGGSWHPMGAPQQTGIVRALGAHGMDVYVSSDALNIGGVAQADHLAKWTVAAGSYSAVGSNTGGANGYFPTSGQINEIVTSGSLLFAAGSWLNANGDPTGDMIAYFDGSTWRPIGSSGAGNGALNANTEGLAVFGGQVYAGGASTGVNGDPLANFAASRSLRLPDAEIGKSSGGYVGNNIYSSTAAGEKKTINIARGTSSYFPILIQNDGLVAASFKLKGTGAASGYTVKFINYANNANITAAVKNGTFSTGSLAPGQSFAMKMVVTLSSSAAAKGTFTVKASSTAGTPPDAVKGIVKAT